MSGWPRHGETRAQPTERERERSTRVRSATAVDRTGGPPLIAFGRLLSARSVGGLLLVAEDALFSAHEPGGGHPERPARLDAVTDGVRESGVADAVTVLAPRDATTEDLERVHDRALLDRVQRLSRSGGGRIDGDTVTSSGSWAAAVRAAGAGLAAVDELTDGSARAAFLGLRPPGHHATAHTSMGFCLREPRGRDGCGARRTR